MTDRPEGTSDPETTDPEAPVAPETESEAAAAPEPEPEAEPDDADASSDAEPEPVVAGTTPSGPRRRAEAKPANRAPTPSELAVHVNEPWSKIFVIVTVAVFVAILLNGFLLGKGGLITGTPTPRPSASATVGPSASAPASASASGSASAPSSASPSAAPSASPSLAPSASIAPSGSPAP